MTAAEKRLVRKRLGVLELAKELGNVSEACRRRGVSRTQFYQYRRRFQTLGLDGLVDRPPVPKSHPHTTPPEVVRKIRDLALAHPAWGCDRLSGLLRPTGASVSGVTIQRILNRRNLGTRSERLLRLEEMAAHAQIALSPEQLAAMEKRNPCFGERHVESSAPGELLCQGAFYIGTICRRFDVYLEAVVDTFGSFAFGCVATGDGPDNARAVLLNQVLPQYEDWGLKVGAIVTGHGERYCGSPSHPFQRTLRLNDIEHRKTKAVRPRINGFLERFRRTAREEFFPTVQRTISYPHVAQWQKDLNAWLGYYNHERPHPGYRNMGKRPIDTVTEFLKTVRKEA